jgi:hypothetical protein
MDRVLELSLRDLAVRRILLEVFHMLKPPTVLFGPPVAAKVLREAVMGSGKTGGSVPAREMVEAA